MKKILILCDGFGECNDATGICVKNVAAELVNRGYVVYCIRNLFNASTYSHKNIHFYGIKQSFYDSIKHLNESSSLWKKSLFKLISIIRHFILVPVYPNVAYFRSREYYKLADSIIQHENIDTVIASFLPFEAIYAVMKLKKKYGDEIYSVAYHLDLMRTVNTKNSFVRRYQEMRAAKVVEKEKKCLDLLVFPEAIRGKDVFSKKLLYADFPVYVKDNSGQVFKLPYKENFYNAVFIGSLGETNRNPAKVLQILGKINEISTKKVHWHIWGNVDESIKRNLAKYDFVEHHGLLENSKVMYALKNADFIINVCNDLTLDMVPSKTFQYFSTKKPILNFIKNRKDASIPYFSRYGLSFSIYVNENQKDVVQELFSFMEKECGNLASFDYALVEKSTPAYVVDLVERAANV